MDNLGKFSETRLRAVVPRRFGRKVGQFFGTVHDGFVSKDMVSPLDFFFSKCFKVTISTYIIIYPHDYFHESHENQFFPYVSHHFGPHFANKKFPMSPEFLSSAVERLELSVGPALPVRSFMLDFMKTVVTWLWINTYTYHF